MQRLSMLENDNLIEEFKKTISSTIKSIGKSNSIEVSKPEGGFYLFPEFTNAKFSSSSEMCKDILNKTGVALLPGSDFGLKNSKMFNNSMLSAWLTFRCCRWR